MMTHMPIRRSPQHAREGKVLAGCLIALAVALVIAITGTVLLVMNWSKLVGWGFEKGADSLVAQLPIDEAEKTEIMTELSGLMTRYKNKDINFEQLALRLESVIDSPAVQAGLISNAAGLYIDASPLSEEEKAVGENELRRLAQGLLDKSIDPSVLRGILEPLQSDGSGNNTITLGVHINGTGKDEFKVLKPSAVTSEQMMQVIESARAQADEAGVDQLPPTIDLSDEIKKAIEQAEGLSVEP